MHIKMKYVERVNSKGKVYFYYRRGGKRLGRLHGNPGSPKWMTDYEFIHAKYEHGSAFRVDDVSVVGSVASTIIKFQTSPKWKKGLKPGTQANYRRCLEEFRAVFGPVQIRDFEHGDLMEYLDRFGDTPGKHNSHKTAIQALFRFAYKRGIVRFNPALGLEPMEVGEHLPWPVAVLEAFRLREDRPDVVNAIDLGLLTRQGIGDCVRVGWNDRKDGFLDFTRMKTGVEVPVPVTEPLRDLLESIPRRAVTILSTPRGRVWSKSYLCNEIARINRENGYPGFTFHGLRKNAAELLAVRGCSDKEIQTLLGQKTPAMASHYSKRAEKKVIALGAIAKLPNFEG